ncbi:MAG: class IV adenylate cyclase [Anaerolineae bacterium]|jgi:adenylate cyclase class 2|nr:class IV adenylate cyclase [Anaerolineae bacterium]
MDHQEIEAKFFLHDLPAFEQRLQDVGGTLSAPRVFESNLRFDTPDGQFRLQRRVLRLRKDTINRLTYKDPGRVGETVSVRREIEFEVSDHDAARQLLEALGYLVSTMYEKYRTTYQLDDVIVVLDEMPFGHFCEIEGPHPEAIERAAAKLRLKWEARCAESYLAIFERFRFQTGIQAAHLTFDELANYAPVPEDLGLVYADQG